MSAETKGSANVVVSDATRAATAPLTALERITLQMTAKLHLDDVLAAISRGLVEEFHAAFARIWLLGPGDLCAACYQAADCANRERCLHLKASAGLYTNLWNCPQHITPRFTEDQIQKALAPIEARMRELQQHNERLRAGLARLGSSDETADHST